MAQRHIVMIAVIGLLQAASGCGSDRDRDIGEAIGKAARDQIARAEGARSDSARVETERAETARIKAEKIEAARVTALTAATLELYDELADPIDPRALRSAIRKVREFGDSLPSLQGLVATAQTKLGGYYRPRFERYLSIVPDLREFIAYYARVQGPGYTMSRKSKRGPPLSRVMRQAVDSLEVLSGTVYDWGTHQEVVLLRAIRAYGGHYINHKFITDNVTDNVTADANKEAADRYFARLNARFARNRTISDSIAAAKGRRTPEQRDSVVREICALVGNRTANCARYRRNQP